MAIRKDVHCVILQYCVVLCSAYSLYWSFKKRCADQNLVNQIFPVVHLWLYRTPRQSKTCFETSYLLLDFCKSKLILNKILFLHTPLQSWFKLLIQLLECAIPAEISKLILEKCAIGKMWEMENVLTNKHHHHGWSTWGDSKWRRRWQQGWYRWRWKRIEPVWIDDNMMKMIIKLWWKWSSKYDDNEHQNMIMMMITIWW